MARDSKTGEYYHPHYRRVSDTVIRELANRSAAYSRDAKVIKSQSDLENALVFSYSKMAYAKVTGIKDDGTDGITMGAFPNIEENSKKDGTLTLYDPVSHKPKYPILQSIEITTSGKYGSVIQSNFSFTVFPRVNDITGNFDLDDIENQFFSPGKEVRIEYGWSTTRTEASNGLLVGIIYNFDWSVNADLSITGKCSICSPGTLVLGISGEQPNPTNQELVYDGGNRPISSGDLIGILNLDINKLPETSTNLFKEINGLPVGTSYWVPSKSTWNKKFGYWVMPMPEADQQFSPENATLLGGQPQQKSDVDPDDPFKDFQGPLPLNAAQNHPSLWFIKTNHKKVEDLLNTRKKIRDDPDREPGERETAAAYVDYIETENKKSKKTHYDLTRDVTKHTYKGKQYDVPYLYHAYYRTTDPNHPGNDNNRWYAENPKSSDNTRPVQTYKQQWDEKLKNTAQNQLLDFSKSETGIIVDAISAPSDSGAGAGDNNQMVVETKYYITLGNLIDYFNALDYPGSTPGSPNSSKIFEFQVWGNTTQYLGSVSWDSVGTSIVSCIPEQVYFPDPYMGSYGAFQPFVQNPTAMFVVDGVDGKITKENMKNGLINIGTILLSTNMVTEIYKDFLSENQTTIDYKNITSFIERIIQKINFASGEMYQLTTHVIDEVEKKRDGKSIVSIEDTNITRSVINSVPTFKINISAETPIVKSMVVSSKPPPASAHAAFVEARAGKSRVITDVKYTSGGGKTDKNQGFEEFSTAIKQVQELKANFSLIGYGNNFTNALKGNYTRIKRTATSNIQKNHWLQRVVFPIELSLTFDGIHGFKFGDTITISYLPKSYVGDKGERFVFTVTKISHSVKDYVWETTLNCKARIQAR